MSLSYSATESLPRGDDAHPVSMGVSFEVRYLSLRGATRQLAFRCDARGNVELNALTESERRWFYYARRTVGREFALPTVVPCAEPRVPTNIGEGVSGEIQGGALSPGDRDI